MILLGLLLTKDYMGLEPACSRFSTTPHPFSPFPTVPLTTSDYKHSFVAHNPEWSRLLKERKQKKFYGGPPFKTQTIIWWHGSYLQISGTRFLKISSKDKYTGAECFQRGENILKSLHIETTLQVVLRGCVAMRKVVEDVFRRKGKRLRHWRRRK